VIRLSLSLPPSLNNAYFNTPKGRALTPEAKAWKNTALLLITNTIRLAGWEVPPKQDVVIIMRLYFKSQRQRDVSNCIKLLEDAVAQALGINDKWVVMPLALRAGVDPHDPRVEVTVFATPEGEVVANATAAYAEGLCNAH
jgi:Holliday junction resolvase RusA-like endonuclease